jgi:hypothetical protein
MFYYLGIGLDIIMLARTGIFAINYQNFRSLSISEVLLGFFYGLRIDLASLPVYSGILLLLWLSSFVRPHNNGGIQQFIKVMSEKTFRGESLDS